MSEARRTFAAMTPEDRAISAPMSDQIETGRKRPQVFASLLPPILRHALPLATTCSSG